MSIFDQAALQKNWKITLVNGYPGAAANDTLIFNLPVIQIWRDGAAQPESTPWATSCSFASDGTLTGIRSSDGQPFTITTDSDSNGSESMTCTFSSSTQRRMARGLVLGTFLGTLFATLAGLAAGSPFLGATIGFIAALTGAGVTFGASSFGNRVDSGGTIVAEEGGPVPRPMPGPDSEPQPLKVVGGRKPR
jgi:hypothetical protein